MLSLPRISALAFLAAAAPALAGPVVPPPETRLIAASAPEPDGSWRLGLEIVLPDGWHTYWRTPGDAGVPPMFDTAASNNLARFDVGYPPPVRYFDGFGTSLVYHDRVVLPVTVAPAAADAPIDLRVRFDFGYCEKICVPATAELSADLAPGHTPDAVDDAAVGAAFAALPVPESEAGPDAPAIAGLAVAGADRNGHVDITVKTSADPAGVDLFVEGPDRWYLSPPEKLSADAGTAVFRVALDGMPRTATPSGATLRFTIVADGRAVEAVRTLD
jgi:DsbC/DsbD-like thiol-disulfide interchange protein